MTAVGCRNQSDEAGDVTMFGKLMNGYFYGKSGKGDFTPDDLPKNRWELFWAMLRVRFSALTRLNMMTIIVFLPYLVIILMNFLSLLTGWTNAVNYQEALTAGTELDPEQFTPELVALFEKFTENGVFQIQNFVRDLTQACLWRMVLLLIPAILITGPAEAGLAYVCRNWARDEHAFIWSDFKDAMRDNWKQAIGISAITSVIPIIMYMCWQFYGNLAADSMFYMIPQMVVVMLGIIWILALVFYYPLMVSYKMTFRQLLKNGMMLSIGRLPQTVGVRLLTLLPAMICLLLLFFTNSTIVFLAIGAFYLIIGIALHRFIYASFTNAVFDRFINSRIEGVRINRGMTEDNDDDDDEDESDGEDDKEDDIRKKPTDDEA